MTPKNDDENQPSILAAPDLRSIYVNWIQLAGGATDFMMTVGEARPLQQGGAEVEQRARLFFTPVQAKVIVAMLGNAIREYEKKFGPINMPALLAEQINAHLGGEENKTEVV